MTTVLAAFFSFFRGLLGRINPGLVSFKADAANDTEGVYEAVADYRHHTAGAAAASPSPIPPPCSNPVYSAHGVLIP